MIALLVNSTKIRNKPNGLVWRLMLKLQIVKEHLLQYIKAVDCEVKLFIILQDLLFITVLLAWYTATNVPSFH